MALLNPSWLWGLLALAVPLAIHLLSRKEGKVIRIGSLRFLHDSPTRQFRSIRLNEILLLTLRACMLLLVVLLLADLYLPDHQERRWVLVSPRLSHHPLATRIIDSLTAAGYERRELASGFPTHDSPSASTQGTQALLTELRQLSLTDAIVLSEARLSDFSGPRTTADGFRWITVDTTPATFTASAVRIGDSLHLRVAETSSLVTTFRSELQSYRAQEFYRTENDSVRISAMDTVKITIHNTETYSNERRYVEAALQAMSQSGFPVQVREYSSSSPINGWLCWLSDSPAPKIPASAQLLFIRPAVHSGLLMHQRDEWQITSRLTEALCTREHFTLQLLSAFFPVDQETSNRIAMSDMRQIPDPMLWKKGTANVAARVEQRASASSWVTALLLLTWILERWVSFRRNQ